MSEGEQLELALKIALALGIGAIIGAEREYRNREAGLRTIALACAGSAIFGIVGEQYGDSRVAASVVQGIGFIGAGVIFQRERTVRNLTTATTIWVAAGLGLMVALDLWLTALIVAIGGVLVLELGYFIDHSIHRVHDDPEATGNGGTASDHNERNGTPD